MSARSRLLSSMTSIDSLMRRSLVSKTNVNPNDICEREVMIQFHFLHPRLSSLDNDLHKENTFESIGDCIPNETHRKQRGSWSMFCFVYRLRCICANILFRKYSQVISMLRDLFFSPNHRKCPFNKSFLTFHSCKHQPTNTYFHDKAHR